MNFPVRNARQPKRIIAAIQDLMKQTGQVPHDTSTLTGMKVQPPAGQGTSEAGRVKPGGAQIPATAENQNLIRPEPKPDTTQKPQTQGTSNYTQQLLHQPTQAQPKPLQPPAPTNYQRLVEGKDISALTAMLNKGLINFQDYHSAIQKIDGVNRVQDAADYIKPSAKQPTPPQPPKSVSPKPVQLRSVPTPLPVEPPPLALEHKNAEEITELTTKLNRGLINFQQYHVAIQKLEDKTPAPAPAPRPVKQLPLPRPKPKAPAPVVHKVIPIRKPIEIKEPPVNSIDNKEINELTTKLNKGLINFKDYHNAIQKMSKL
jgi:hypothetical protein